MEKQEGSTQEPHSSSVELPQYQCHKVVRAAKITHIVIGHENDGSGLCNTLTFGEIGGFERVSDEWINRHEPHEGGYFVRYEDGYSSFSPRNAFVQGYIKI